MAEVDDKSRKTHSWQCVFELSKGAQCQDETASCFAVHVQKSKKEKKPVNSEPWTCTDQRALTHELR